MTEPPRLFTPRAARVDDGLDEDRHLEALESDRLKSLSEFGSLSVTEVLDQDSRPTFVIDLDPDESITVGSRRIVPIFCNNALRLHEKLLDIVLGNTAQGQTPGEAPKRRKSSSYEAFSSWATGVTRFDSSRDVFPQSFVFQHMVWTGSTIRQRWRLISGNLLLEPDAHPDSTTNPPAPQTSDDRIPSASTEASANTADAAIFSAPSQTRSSASSLQPPPPRGRTSATSSDRTSVSSQTKFELATSTPEMAVADWTVPNPKGLLSPHMAFARTVDWGSTPLGPMKDWSPEFRQLANLVMSNPHPAALFWGSELTMLYNEAYAVEVAGNKHPGLMGTGFFGPFAELWDSVSGIFAECARTGVSIRKDDDYLPIEKRGFLEETFYSWSWTPLYGGTNRILGFYNAPFDTTMSVLSQRRMRTINQVGEYVSGAKTIKQFWKLLLESLADNEFDVPLAILYSVAEGEDGVESSASCPGTLSLKSCHLEGAIGVPEGHQAAPRQLDLKRTRQGFLPAFREAMRTRELTLLRTKDGTLPEELLEGIPWRGFGDPCTQAIIFPIRPTNGDSVLAFLVLGVNPRRPYNEGYVAFARMLNRQFATALASCMLYEEEVRRSRDLAETAALEQEHLAQQLALQTSRLRRMTELSPLGMYLVSPDGVLREGNDRYFEMTGHPREDIYEMSWMEQLEEASKPVLLAGWNHMVVDHLPWSGEVQLKPPPGFRPPMDLEMGREQIEYWVLVTAQPELSPDGSVRSVMGSITDISHLKWAQGLQNRRLQEAEETRRQQNEFIDITSHEMRNPLSAILQCAEDIVSTLDSLSGETAARLTPEAVEGCLDAARTISLCVQHQKSIVDDVLTVSKLDSNLLVLTPVPGRPLEIVERSIKMFDAEMHAKNIRITCRVDPCFQAMKVDWVMLDPARVLQILINLITNAIKFTAGAAKRDITVTVRASRDATSDSDAGMKDFQYVPAKTRNTSVAAGEEWGAGELLHLGFQVSDTGVGLTPEQVKVLFERFSQASPRTHAQYGGSGLGLFISRQIAELHGGQIGVSSKAGSGSTFGFFVTARRAEPPHARKWSDGHPDRAKIGHDKKTRVEPVVPQRRDFASPGGPAAPLVPTKSSPTTFDPHGLTVLVVEDNLVNQTVLVKQLSKVGCSVHVANDGLEGLAFLKKSHFYKSPSVGGEDSVGTPLSVILMDLEMPNMDGLTCVREIRRMEGAGVIRGRVPVIAVTANVRDEHIAQARRSGMDDVVSKPFRIPSLMAKIETLLSKAS